MKIIVFVEDFGANDSGNAERLAAAMLIQIGPDAILPDGHAYAYDRNVTLTAYADRVAGITPT